MTTITNDIRDRLDQHDWQEMIPRLTRFALSQIRRRIWYLGRAGDVAAGRMAEDFVMDVIMKVYKGVRRWNPQTCPDLLGFLMHTLRSEINHHCMSRENRTVMYMEVVTTSQTAEPVDPPDDPALDLAAEFYQGFLAYLIDDKALTRLIDLIVCDLKPRDIARELQMERKDVYNLMRRLRRRFEEYAAQRRE